MGRTKDRVRLSRRTLGRRLPDMAAHVWRTSIGSLPRDLTLCPRRTTLCPALNLISSFISLHGLLQLSHHPPATPIATHSLSHHPIQTLSQ
ncbi:hypothetical protein BD309DRAFT_665832 [Dichomitus squalens]|nr:hypothetical protein BD309DRAFT_665832 [Dichomitus squalens]